MYEEHEDVHFSFLLNKGKDSLTLIPVCMVKSQKRRNRENCAHCSTATSLFWGGLIPARVPYGSYCGIQKIVL